MDKPRVWTKKDTKELLINVLLSTITTLIVLKVMEVF